MARLTVILQAHDWTARELRKAIADLDATTDEVGIDENKVKALDVLTSMLNGELGVTFEVLEDLLED